MSEHELWNELGNLYFISGAYDQAAYAYHRSIQLDSGFGKPYSNLALTYVQQGKYQDAVELYRRSIELLDDDTEKAISWNRLGNLHRQLREYPTAVAAYRKADELDPQVAADFLDGTQGRMVSSQPPRASPDAAIPGDSNTGADTKTPANAEDERRASQVDDATASWTPADPSEYQQDLSISPDPGSLTTWGDCNFDDDDLDVFPALEPDANIYVPDTDDRDMGNWLPIPEEEPSQELEIDAYIEEADKDNLQSISSAAVAQPAGDLKTTSTGTPVDGTRGEKDTPHSTFFAVPEPTALKQPVTTESSASGAHVASIYVERIDDESPKTHTNQSTEVDIQVEEQPFSEFVVTAGRENDPLEVLPERELVPVEAVGPALEAEADAAEKATDLERDEQEMHEIEAEIAKFKRVVQINPRNAHAWDALGTLYKSAENYKEAILAYQQAISSDSSRSQYYHHLGLVYACEGRDEDAIGAFQRVIELDPGHSLAHATLGGYYRKMGLEELAQQHIGKAMKSIFDSENEYNRACLQAICGNADQAIDLLRVALKNKQTYVDWILRDPDLDFIRQDPRFKQLISDYTR